MFGAHRPSTALLRTRPRGLPGQEEERVSGDILAPAFGSPTLLVARFVASDQCRLKSAARVVLLVLAERWVSRRTLSTRSTAAGPAGPSVATIARACGLSSPTVIKAIKELEAAGVLRVERGGSRRDEARSSSEYSLLVDNLRRNFTGTTKEFSCDHTKNFTGTTKEFSGDHRRNELRTTPETAIEPLTDKPASRTRAGEICASWPGDAQPRDRAELEETLRSMGVDPGSHIGREAIHFLIVNKFPFIAEKENAVLLAQLRSGRATA
ncbi:MAG: helix-turn-helix domain-containing protein [Vicinamibacteria bacterium]|nr:helix-turn-helix domain-containing protein [Vicinamibacteria bacterium]